MPYTFNPFTGNLDYYQAGGGSGGPVKGTVAAAANLPAMGNSDGDTYIVVGSNYSFWTWNNSTSKWMKQTPYVPLRSVTLDGVSKKISVGQNFSFETTSTWSMSVWVKLLDANGGGVLSKTNGTSLGWNCYCNNSGQPTFFFNGGGSAMGITVTSPTLSTNTWYHITYTYDGSKTNTGMLIYINGVLASTVDRSSNTCPATIINTHAATFGSIDVSLFLNAKMDEVSFYNTVLNSSQVTTLYNLGTPFDLYTLSFYSNLTNWYKIGDFPDNYTTIYDAGPVLANATGANLVNTDFTSDVP